MMRQLTENEISCVSGGAAFEHRAFRDHVATDLAQGSGRGLEQSYDRAWPAAGAIATGAGLLAPMLSPPVLVFAGATAAVLAGTRLYAEMFPAKSRQHDPR